MPRSKLQNIKFGEGKEKGKERWYLWILLLLLLQTSGASIQLQDLGRWTKPEQGLGWLDMGVCSTQYLSLGRRTDK